MGVSGKLLKSVQAAEEILVKAAKHRALRAKPWPEFNHPSLTFGQNLAVAGRLAGRTEEEIAQQMLNSPDSIKVLIAGARKRDPELFIPNANSASPFQMSSRGRHSESGLPLDWEGLAKSVRRIGTSGDTPILPTEVAINALGTKSPASLQVSFNHGRGGRFGPEVQSLLHNLKGLRGGGYQLLGLGGLGTVGAAGALGALYGQPEEPAYA